MANAISGTRKRGRPATGAVSIHVRIEPDQLTALDAVILTPAPTLADVVFKLELGLSDGVFDGSDDSTRMLGVVADDLRRLSRPTAKAIWDDLMTRYLAAKAEEDDYAARVHDPMFEDNSCADTDERRAVADEMERLASIRHALMLNLVRATAPDQSALLWKLEWLLNERDSMCWSDAVLDPIQHDVRRILNREIQSGQ